MVISNTTPGALPKSRVKGETDSIGKLIYSYTSAKSSDLVFSRQKEKADIWADTQKGEALCLPLQSLWALNKN